MTTKDQQDIIIIGAGASGSLAAQLCSRNGYKTLLIDFGHDLNDEESADNKSFSYQTSSYAFNDVTKKYIADDPSLHFKSEKEKFYWSHAHALGGRSLLWQGVSLRFTDKQFKAPLKDQWGIPWPIGEKELNPYYDKVEEFYNIGAFNSLEKTKAIEKLKMKLGLNIISCPYTAKYFTGVAKNYSQLVEESIASHLLSTENSNLQIQGNSVVTSLTLNSQNGKVDSIQYKDKRTGQNKEVSGKVVILCASTLESTRILLNSKTSTSSESPFLENGLGQNLMTHLKGVSLSTNVLQTPYVRKPEELIHVPFQEGFHKDSQLLRGWGLQFRQKENLTNIKINAFGEGLPYKENKITIDKNKLDQWGRPELNISFTYGENEERMRQSQILQMKDIAQKLDLKDYKVGEKFQGPGKSNHELGTARMGESPKNSVLNKYNQVWDFENLYVCDGSSFTTGGYQNPTLTILALTWRACDHISEQLGKV